MVGTIISLLILVGFTVWVVHAMWRDILWLIDNWNPPKEDEE